MVKIQVLVPVFTLAPSMRASTVRTASAGCPHRYSACAAERCSRVPGASPQRRTDSDLAGLCAVRRCFRSRKRGSASASRLARLGNLLQLAPMLTHVHRSLGDKRWSWALAASSAMRPSSSISAGDDPNEYSPNTPRHWRACSSVNIRVVRRLVASPRSRSRSARENCAMWM